MHTDIKYSADNASQKAFEWGQLFNSILYSRMGTIYAINFNVYGKKFMFPNFNSNLILTIRGDVNSTHIGFILFTSLYCMFF